MSGTSLEQHRTGYRLPVAAPPHNEGKTVAAWSVMLIVTLGVLVSCVGLILDIPVLTWVAGPIVVVAALVVGLVLRLSGQGQPRRSEPARDWYEVEEQPRATDADARGAHERDSVADGAAR
ncbi:HGxxPAAW family protein [Georgenia sp. Z1344]|uniref:HGxxPAAW family protein n=1 Tax=Georgenia sp. Z1344 TaxID=3416706 RepID=UPI003CF9E383